MSRNDKKPLPVPLSISLLHKCARYQISGDVIKRLHYTDLLLLLMRLDVAEYEAAEERQRKTNESVSLSGKEAVSLFKGL